MRRGARVRLECATGGGRVCEGGLERVATRARACVLVVLRQTVLSQPSLAAPNTPRGLHTHSPHADARPSTASEGKKCAGGGGRAVLCADSEALAASQPAALGKRQSLLPSAEPAALCRACCPLQSLLPSAEPAAPAQRVCIWAGHVSLSGALSHVLTWDSERACSTSVRASAESPLIATPTCESIS